jgi:hypothetical protein
MKLVPDHLIRTAYRSTKSALTRGRRLGSRPGTLAELEARLEFLERVFDLG